MRQAEKGFLLLTCSLGDPLRKPLTVAQFRLLARRARQMDMPLGDRELTLEDLGKLGYDKENARRILHLLSQEDLLAYYLRRCQKAQCGVLSRVSDLYPQVLRQKLDPDSPASLWTKGDISLLTKPAVALVGSRDIRPANRDFARQVGRQAAYQGYVLVSGNARGADKEAQNACLEAGGEVICVIADSLEEKRHKSHVLYLSEEGFDLPFSAQRALHRNRMIHALAEKTFVAQCTWGRGGTWDGTLHNLKNGLSPVYCFEDGSQAMAQLAQMGARMVGIPQLSDIRQLDGPQISLFD